MRKHTHHWICDPPNGEWITSRCDCGKKRRFPSQGVTAPGNAGLFTKRTPQRRSP